MKRVFRVAAVLCLFAAAAALAQTPPFGYVNVTGSNVRDSSGNLLASGTISFAPVNNNAVPISYRATQGQNAQISATVSGGSVTGVSISNGGEGYPQNVFITANCTDPPYITATVASGVITGLTLDFGGTGCPSVPTFTIVGAGQTQSTAVTATVTNGVFSLPLADTWLTSPQNVCFLVTIVDNTTGNQLLGGGYSCVQPSGMLASPAVTGTQPWCSPATGAGGGTCNWDAYIPNVTPNLVGVSWPTFALQIGTVNVLNWPATPSASITGSVPNQSLNLNLVEPIPNTLAIGTVTTLSPGSSATASITGAAPNQTLSLGVPAGNNGSISGGTPMSGSTVVGPPAAAVGGTSYATAYFSPGSAVPLAAFGGVCDAQLLSGSWTASSHTITVSGLQPFTTGAVVVIPNGVSAGNPLITTGTYVSSTSMTVATAPTISGSAGAPVYIVVGTDNTTAISTSLTAFNSGTGSILAMGGTLLFPPGKCLVDGQIEFPNDGVGIGILSVPHQAPIAWRGVGNDVRDGIHGAGRNLNNFAGSMIVDTYPGGSTGEPGGVAVAKIETYGAGILAVDHLAFADPANDSLPFLLTTGTTLQMRDYAFVGSMAGTSANQDAILEGGANYSSSTLDDPTASFQGYCALFENGYFNYVRRVLYGQSRVDCNHFSWNYIDSQSGSNLSSGGAVVMSAPSASQNSNGAYIGNRCEITNYAYCFKFTNSNGNFIAFSDVEDALGGPPVADVDYEGTSQLNINICSNHAGAGILCQTDNNTNGSSTANNTLISTITSDGSIYSSPHTAPAFTAQNAAGYGTGASGFSTTPGVAATSGVNKPAGYFSSVTSESYSGSVSQNDTCGWQQSYSSNSANNPTMITEYVCTLGTSGGSKLELPLATYFGTSLPTEIDASGDLIIGSSANIQISGGLFMSGTTIDADTFAGRSSSPIVVEGTGASGGGTTAEVNVKSSSTLNATDVVVGLNNAGTNLRQFYGDGMMTQKTFTVSGLQSCVTGLKGATAIVTDASSPTFLATVTGGGSTVAPVMCNGSNWVAY